MSGGEKPGSRGELGSAPDSHPETLEDCTAKLRKDNNTKSAFNKPGAGYRHRLTVIWILILAWNILSTAVKEGGERETVGWGWALAPCLIKAAHLQRKLYEG